MSDQDEKPSKSDDEKVDEKNLVESSVEQTSDTVARDTSKSSRSPSLLDLDTKQDSLFVISNDQIHKKNSGDCEKKLSHVQVRNTSKNSAPATSNSSSSLNVKRKVDEDTSSSSKKQVIKVIFYHFLSRLFLIGNFFG